MIKIFVINLERSLDRHEFMLQQFNKIGITADFFPAVNGAKLALEWRQRCSSRLNNMLLGNPGFNVDNEIACFASHFLLWQKCVELNEAILILEDDISLTPDFKAKLPMVEKLVNNLGYLRLMALEHGRGKVCITKSLTCYLHHPCGTQGYAITPRGARLLLDNARMWSEPVDIYLDKYWLHGLRPYCLNPEIITHEEEIKSLISGNSGREKQYLPKPRGAIKLVREIFIRPAQKLKRKIFELRHPILTKLQLESYLD